MCILQIKKRKCEICSCLWNVWRALSWKLYHMDCLEDVLCFPENYGHKMADMALHLTERIKDYKIDIERRKDRLSDACKYIKNNQ